MSNLSDAHDRAIERGRNDAIYLVPITPTPIKRVIMVWAWHGNMGGALISRLFTTVGNGQGHSLSGM
jgi:hypothetical protein